MKRIGAVCLYAAFFACLCQATTTVTISGSVYSGTDNYGNVFSTSGTSTSLAGFPFTLVYTFDKTAGSSSSSTCGGSTPAYSQTTGTDTSATAVLTINGKPFTFGGSSLGRTSGSWYVLQYAAVSCSTYPNGSTGYNVAATYGSGGFSGSSAIVNGGLGPSFFPPSGSSFTSAADWQGTSFSLTTDSNSGRAFPFLVNYSSGSGTTFFNVSGYLAPEFLSVNGQQPTQLAKTLGNQQSCDACLGNGNSPDGSPKASNGLHITSISPAVSPRGRVLIADPIDPSTGNVFEELTDYTTAGQNPLAFRRYYNSMGATSGTFASMLGVGWRSNYDRYLHILPASSPTTVIAERPDGQSVTFKLVSGSWTSDSDVEFTLTHSSPNWTLTGRDDTVESYGDNSNGSATLNTITFRNGYSQTLNYSSGRLSTVTDSYTAGASSRQLGFSYTNGLLTTLTTPDSSTGISFGYNASLSGGVNDQLITVTYPTTTPSTLTYIYGNSSFPYALTAIKDENNSSGSTHYADWTYDSAGRATTNYMGDTGLQADKVTISYASSTPTVTNAGATGVVDTYSYTTRQGVPKLDSISRAATTGSGATAAATRNFTYDTNGYLASATDWNGNKTNYTNNSHGQPTQIDEGIPSGSSTPTRSTTISYDTTYVHLPACITTTGMTTAFVYYTSGSGAGSVHTRTDTDTTVSGSTACSTSGTGTRTWTYTYTSTGQLASVNTPRIDLTQTTSYGYTNGTLTSITDPLGHVTQITAASNGGQPTTIVEAYGITGQQRTTTLTYDQRQRLHTSALSTTGGTLTTTYDHDAAENLTKVTQPDSSYLAYTYDAAHRLTQIQNANCVSTVCESINYTLNAFGKPTQTDTKDTGSTVKRHRTATVDNLGRMLTDVAWKDNSNSMTTTYAYDATGNVTSIQDPRSHTTSRTFDALNRLHTLTDRIGTGSTHTTTINYDTHDRVTSVVDFLNNTTTYTRDGLGRVKQLVSPDSATTAYTYDPVDNITQKVADSGGANITTNLTYDAGDRELTRHFPGNTAENIAKTYDQTTSHGFGIGRLTEMTDVLGTIDYTYDERGNSTYETRTYGGITSAMTTYYDNASRISAIVYPDGWAGGWFRDAAGQVTEVALEGPGGSPGVTAVVGDSTHPITHLPFGPVTGMRFQNTSPITRTTTYDLAYRMTNLTDNGTSTVLNLDYSYDANGNIAYITDHVNTANSQGTSGSPMTYDNEDRLTAAASGSGGYGSYSWTYDTNGNRLTEVNNGTTSTYTIAGGAGTSNRLTAVSVGSYGFGYNGAGSNTSITVSGTTVLNFGMTQEQQLASVTAPGTPPTTIAMYYFDGNNDRGLKSVSVATGFKYARHGALYEEGDTVGHTTDYLYLDPSNPAEAFYPVAMIGHVTSGGSTTDTTYFVHADRIGTPQKVTDLSQTVQWSTTYLPFGATTPTGSITQNLRLPGQYYDSETGLYNNGARTYAPLLGRYIQSDPIGLAAGTPNAYAYANNNPLRWADPQGTDLWEILTETGRVLYGKLLGREIDEAQTKNNTFQLNTVWNTFWLPYIGDSDYSQNVKGGLGCLYNLAGGPSGCLDGYIHGQTDEINRKYDEAKRLWWEKHTGDICYPQGTSSRSAMPQMTYIPGKEPPSLPLMTVIPR
jgi:RHS repeat-associated protein